MLVSGPASSSKASTLWRLWRLDTQVPDLPSGFPGLWDRGDVAVMSWRPLRALQYQNEPPTILSCSKG